MRLLRHTWGPTTDVPEGLEAESIDLVVADPPYNYGVRYAEDPTGDRLRDDDYRLGLLYQTLRVTTFMLKPDGVAAWVAPAEYGGMVWDLARQVHLEHIYGAPVVWHETFSQYQSKRLTKDYRLVFLMKKRGGDPPFHPDEIRIESERQRMGDKRADPRGRVPGMVWKLRRLQGTSTDRVDWHPAQLPPELVQRLVLGWSNPGATVLDPFAGSGNVGLVCQREGREFVGVDRSQLYLDKIRERLG